DPFVFMKGVAKYHVRSLPADSRQGVEFRHCVGHFSAVFLDDFAHGATDALRFVAIKPRGFDRAFQFGERSVRIIPGGTIFPKQNGRDHVDASVRRLRRENGRDKQLERVPKIQFAMRVWINFWPGFYKLPYAFANSHRLLIWKLATDFNPAS